MRVGTGYDVHRLGRDRDLILGGVRIPYEFGLIGHSDADVLVHAIMDALLGAAALGDIGKHFPDTDEKYKGISSLKLLSHVGDLLAERHWIIENIDATIIAQKPKMRPYIEEMIKNIAQILGIETSQVNVKATTEEGLSFTGRCEGISSQAVCLLSSVDELDSTVIATDVLPNSGRSCSSCPGCGAFPVKEPSGSKDKKKTKKKKKKK
ncbi:MAG: 2-C-methyl-D-erythritol 2,4-cyclodiphosphate synthase [Lachnospiraceae bacterium]|nr:2-C-methyl-D-erythritol 2,4-cyclodiphosphate synthase [Lachnospiraceae bacterium]